MKFIAWIVRNPVKVSVGVLLVALFGFVALTRMPMQLTPEVEQPVISVETRWPGASPQEVEREIIIEQEEYLKSVQGVTEMTSESGDSQGEIRMEFAIGTDMQQAVVEVISQLQQVPDYPEDADMPIVETSSSSDRAIAWFILSSRRPSEEEFAAFAEKHPQLADEIDVPRRTENAGLMMLRLRFLAQKHPEVRELLPPEDFEVTELQRFTENNVKAAFERVPGVSQSNVIGGLEDEIQVIVDPQKLAARGLTIPDVRRVLRSQNEDISGGDLWEGKRRYVVRTRNQFRSPEQVEKQLLAARDGSPVYVRDVAEVRHGYKKPTGFVRRFGESAIAVNVVRETGANVLDVMDGLRRVNRELNEGILKQRGLQLTQVYDETDYINSSIGLVQQNLFIGGALTMIVLMVFLHLGMRTLLVVPFVIASALAAAYVSPWFFAIAMALILGAGFWFARGALVVGLAIPTSIIGTFLMLDLMGRSLNVVSLAGMAFAVGMLVDNAVVVLENVYRRYQMGEPPFTAAVKGTQEVWGAVASSTLTTIAVFLPVVFVEEEAGQLFRDIALAISAAVALSLAVSMTLIPTASARLFGGASGDEPEGADGDGRYAEGNGADPRRAPEAQTHERGSASEMSRWRSIPRVVVGSVVRVGSAFVATVVGLNNWIQRGLVRRLAVVGLLVGTAVGLSYQFWPQVEYLPSGNRNLVMTFLLPPPGYNLPELMQMGEKIEQRLQPYWDIDPRKLQSGESFEDPVIDDWFYVARGSSVFMGLRARDPMRAAELIPVIQSVTSDLPGTIATARQSSLFARGLGAGRTVDVDIVGPDLEKLVALGGRVFSDVKDVVPNAQARPIPSLDLSSPEVHINPKLVQSAEMGVTAADLGYTADALIDGAYAGDYYLGGEKIDLTLMGQQQYAKQTHDIAALPVATPLQSFPVPLGALADVELSSGPQQINHRERQRAVTIQVTPPATTALETAMTRINEQIVRPLQEGGELEGGYRITLSGTADKLRDTWDALRFNVLLALVITYLLMAALFESWLYPFVIIFSVPLGAVGGILGLNLLNLGMYLGNGVGLIPAFNNILAQEFLQPLDVLTMLGFVILIGTVVNNPILIVHQSLNHMREDGMESRQAILESVRTRIRPIFMTTTTTVLGLLPLVIFPGSGSELYRGLGSVVLGGLLVSTVFTLFLVPTLFSLTMDAKDLIVSLLRKIRPSRRRPAPVEEQPREQVPVS